MSDWFTDTYEKFLVNAAEDTGITVEQARNFYSFLAEQGLIDYDQEKEVYWDMYNG